MVCKRYSLAQLIGYFLHVLSASQWGAVGRIEIPFEEKLFSAKDPETWMATAYPLWLYAYWWFSSLTFCELDNKIKS